MSLCSRRTCACTASAETPHGASHLGHRRARGFSRRVAKKKDPPEDASVGSFFIVRLAGASEPFLKTTRLSSANASSAFANHALGRASFFFSGDSCHDLCGGRPRRDSYHVLRRRGGAPRLALKAVHQDAAGTRGENKRGDGVEVRAKRFRVFARGDVLYPPHALVHERALVRRVRNLILGAVQDVRDP